MIPLQLGGLVADWRVSLERPSLGEGGGTPGNFIQLITNAGRGWGVIGSELLTLLGHGLGSGTPSEPLLHLLTCPSQVTQASHMAQPPAALPMK